MKSIIIFLKEAKSLGVLLILLFFNGSVFSQIIYTDIPDATPNATYALDLNNDTIVDFLIQFDLSDKVMCKPQNNNAYSGDFAGGNYLPWALASSISICDSLQTWYDYSKPGVMAWGTNIGQWVGATNKYLALKLIVGANTYYGWVRIDVLAISSSFTIKDYAYQSTPKACIKSGQTTLGIKEYSAKNYLTVSPNPITASTTIQTTDNLNNATLTIYNAQGQAVKQVKNINGQTVSVSRDMLPNGIYFIRVEDENNIIAVEKIILID